MDWILLALGSGLLFGILSATVAEFRDISRRKGFAFGFFFGVFGLFYICIMKKPEDEYQIMQYFYPDMVTCYCGQVIPVNSPACPYCGTVFGHVPSLLAVQSDASSAAKTGPLRSCPHCEKPLSRESNFCKYCGTPA